jgi:hypothetical protein
MLKKTVQETKEIVESILTKPLSIKGLDKNISLFEAAQKYIKEPTSLELKKITEMFLNHPETFQVMLQEFAILAQELS